MKYQTRSWLITGLLCLTGIIGSCTCLAQTETESEQFALNRAWWREVRSRIETVIAEQERTLSDLEAPKWYEVPYSTVGRMPLIDTCLREPLTQPEVALWADEQVRQSAANFTSLMKLAYNLAEELDAPLPSLPAAEKQAVWCDQISATLLSTALPSAILEPTIMLLRAMDHATTLRQEAVARLTSDELEELVHLLPAYFIKQTPNGEVVRGYTTDLSDCVSAIKLLERVDFRKLFSAASIMAQAADQARAAFLEWKTHASIDEVQSLQGPLYQTETPLGPIIIGGTGTDTYQQDYALLIDLGGNDLYLNHACATSFTSGGVAVLFDLAGNDTYRNDDYAQGVAVAGVAVFVELGGADSYLAGHYSQGAALGGFSMFYEESGDDTYVGDFGVQGFALFGYSLFIERAGSDTYRCASMGQAVASTLGVTILAEVDGDDVYTSGGKYGFYSTDDASCAQGAASGMREWPPKGKYTVYGGIALLCEVQGNDVYHARIIGQGGSYIFALGMLVDSAGNDVYTAERYTRGVGVHVGAAVAIDRSGNDVYTGFYGNNGYSLDRSSGVFVDFAGDDTYRTTGGIGYGHKPRGCGIFVDIAGNDLYNGSQGSYGQADWPFGEDLFSTGFFLDCGGSDQYLGSNYENNKQWSEGAFGYGEDREIELPASAPESGWAPLQLQASSESRLEPDSETPAAFLKASLALGRLQALRYVETAPDELLNAAVALAADGSIAQRRNLIDVLHVLRLENKLNPTNALALVPLLNLSDRDMKILALHTFRELAIKDHRAMTQAAALALADESAEVRGVACLALGSSSWRGARANLEAALSDHAWTVRRRAAIGLGELSDRAAFNKLAQTLVTDGSHQVRGRVAEALGKLKVKKAIPLLRQALEDNDDFVKVCAARSLVTQYQDIDALSRLIDLLAWDNSNMRASFINEFLVDFTGHAAGNADAWREWLQDAELTFSVARHAAVYEALAEARSAKESGDALKAIKLYRAMQRKEPNHQGVRKDLAELLNGRAWELAVIGEELNEALRMAQESVELNANALNLDTLAVCHYLKGHKDQAIETLQSSMETVAESERSFFETRIQEFETGEVVLN